MGRLSSTPRQRAGGYVDLHCHLLPGVDDGPATVEEARDMLRIAAAEGFTDVVATPHYAPDIPGFSGDRKQADAIFSRMADYAAAFGIALHEGNEIRLDEHAFRRFSEGACRALGTNRHVLLELPDDADPEVCFGWMTPFAQAGWTPVIAHVERLNALHAKTDALEAWREAGCLLQLNARTLVSRFHDPRRRLAKHLLKTGQVHVVATDAHSPRTRSPVVREAGDVLTRWLGEAQMLRLLRDNPREVLGLPAWA